MRIDLDSREVESMVEGSGRRGGEVERAET